MKQKDRSRAFYDNIGREPHIINKYARPKGLQSFKMNRSTSESETEFLMRKGIHQQEKNYGFHDHIMRS